MRIRLNRYDVSETDFDPWYHRFVSSSTGGAYIIRFGARHHLWVWL